MHELLFLAEHKNTARHTLGPRPLFWIIKTWIPRKTQRKAPWPPVGLGKGVMKKRNLTLSCLSRHHWEGSEEHFGRAHQTYLLLSTSSPSGSHACAWPLNYVPTYLHLFKNLSDVLPFTRQQLKTQLKTQISISLSFIYAMLFLSSVLTSYRKTVLINSTCLTTPNASSQRYMWRVDNYNVVIEHLAAAQLGFLWIEVRFLKYRTTLPINQKAH